MKAFYAFYQKTMTSCESYMESITNMHGVIIYWGEGLREYAFLINNNLKDAVVEPPNANYQQVDTAKTEAKEDYMTVTFLSGLNHNRYGQLMNDIHNAFSMGRGEYPKILTSAYDL